MSWSAQYIGLPYAAKGRTDRGCDCWGLACLVYAQELGITLPRYDNEYACDSERAEIAALISAENAPPNWQELDQNAAQPFDLVLFRPGRLAAHVGIMVDARRALHMDRTDHAKILDLQSPMWRGRIEGVYRHFKAPVNASVKVV